MAKINFNYNNKTIEVSESFANKARVYNSKAYNELLEVQKSHPNYSIKIVKSSTKNKRTIIKGINIEFMRNYIERHNEDNYLEKFDNLINDGLSFLELRAKFVEHYPIFKNCKTKADWILAA